MGGAGQGLLRILYIEPFHAGSHRRFGETLIAGVPATWTALTLPGRHWKWRMRGAAPTLYLTHRTTLDADHDLLLASSFLDLATLVGLSPRLGRIPKVLYFHENQLAYPVREHDERDHHYGVTQLASALAADRVVFNSAYNRDSFVEQGQAWLARMPRPRPRGWIEAIAARAEVLPLPLDLGPLAAPAPDPPPGPGRARGPLVVWNHRWEHDKAPERFFRVMARLLDRGVPYRLAVLGERTGRIPACFEAARHRLGARLEVFGGVEDRAAYLGWLGRAQLAVSTAEQEFFGIAAIEASHAGALTLVPDRLAYPEVFPPGHRYRDDAELERRLETACRSWTAGALDLRADRSALTDRFGPPTLAAWTAALDRWAKA